MLLGKITSEIAASNKNLPKITKTVHQVGLSGIPKQKCYLSGLNALASYNIPFCSGKCDTKKLIGQFSIENNFNLPDKTIKDLDELTPEKSLLVHLTDYLPINAKIKTTASSGDYGRNTLHFGLNHSVTNPLGAGGKTGWTDKKYSLILPFDKACKMPNAKSYGGRHNDFMFVDNLDLPKGSFIVKQNTNLKDGIVEFSEANKKLPELVNTKGITLIETNMTPYEATDLLIEKLGYTNLKKMYAEKMGMSIEEVNLMNNTENYIGVIGDEKEAEKKLFELFNNEEFIEKTLKRMELNEKWNDDWASFCSKYNFKNCNHINTIFSKTEDVFLSTGLLSKINNNWHYDGVNCKQEILKTLDKIKNTDEVKYLNFNLEEVYKTIKKSATPQEASETLYKDFKIKTTPENTDKTDPSIIQSELKRILNNLTAEEDDFFFNY